MTGQKRAEQIADFALSQIGVRFRLHGRSPGLMLDCVGLVLTSLDAAGYPAPAPALADYQLRGDYAQLISRLAKSIGLMRVEHKALQIGDILVVRCGPLQTHLLVAVLDGCVHAHAALGRVVFLPGHVPWPILQIWRGSD